MTEGTLKKNEIGRWEFAHIELTSGDAVEVFVGQWIEGRVEHDGRDYVLLVGEQCVTIRLQAGMQARLPQTARPRYR